MHIAIVGCGFTGTSALFQLVDQYPVEKITIFEATGDFGPGYPYRLNECEDYLINNTTDTMCLDPSNRTAFWHWIQGRPDLVSKPIAKGHLPRSIFGHFLKDVFAATRVNAAVKGIQISLVPHRVTDIQEGKDDTGVTIVWNEGKIIADAVLLTTGRCIDKEPFPTSGKDGTLYFPTHICNGQFDTLPMNAEVYIMGASLSAYDVINRLFSPRTGCSFARNADGVMEYIPGPNRRQAVLCSRSGRMKGIQSVAPKRLTRNAFTPDRIHALATNSELNLTALKTLFGEDAVANGIELDIETLNDPYKDCNNSRDVTKKAQGLLLYALEDATKPGRTNFLVDILADAQIDLWDLFAARLLPADEETRYRDEFETAVLCFAAPCPAPTAEKILALIDAGQLRIIKGARGVQKCDDGTFEISHSFGVERATVLVNTIGSVNRMVRDPDQDELTRNLAESRLLRPYVRAGVEKPGADIDMESFKATGTRNIYVANMMLWGPGFFTSSAFMMATIVQRLLDNLFRDD